MSHFGTFLIQYQNFSIEETMLGCVCVDDLISFYPLYAYSGIASGVDVLVLKHCV